MDTTTISTYLRENKKMSYEYNIFFLFSFILIEEQYMIADQYLNGVFAEIY